MGYREAGIYNYSVFAVLPVTRYYLIIDNATGVKSMALRKVKKFSRKEKDFATGKMVSPPREFWETCDCCGRAIVQGVVMSNGDHIGDDCYEVVLRVPNELMFKGNADSLFQMFGTAPKVQRYALKAAE